MVFWPESISSTKPFHGHCLGATGAITKNLPKEQLFDALTVTAMQKAAGITIDKMLEIFHDGIVIKPKERTLTVK